MNEDYKALSTSLAQELTELEYRWQRAVNWETDKHRRELELENDRFRRALRRIADYDPDFDDEWSGDIAKAALSATGGGERG